MKCAVCGAPPLAGALLCVCGSPLPVAAGPGAVPIPAAAAAAPLGAIGALASPTGAALKVVGQTQAFALPGDDFSELLLGRHDLEARPPVVVDLDLGPLSPRANGGFALSRRQARLSRRAGQLYLCALGGAQTLHRRVGAGTAFTVLPTNQEIALEPGDRVAFGSGDRALVLELE